MSNKKHPAMSFRRKTCVIATEIAISLMAAPLAFAQQPAEKVEKIEITGTRIKAQELEGASPIAVISAEDIKFEGVKNVENMLNNLPQVFAEYGKVNLAPTQWEIGQPEDSASAQEFRQLGIVVLRYEPKDPPKANFFTQFLDWLMALMKRKQS